MNVCAKTQEFLMHKVQSNDKLLNKSQHPVCPQVLPFISLYFLFFFFIFISLQCCIITFFFFPIFFYSLSLFFCLKSFTFVDHIHWLVSSRPTETIYSFTWNPQGSFVVIVSRTFRHVALPTTIFKIIRYWAPDGF